MEGPGRSPGGSFSAPPPAARLDYCLSASVNRSPNSDAKEVLKNLAPIDREVVGANERYYTMRIAPYRTTENNIRGLVITIIDSLYRPQAVSSKQ